MDAARPATVTLALALTLVPITGCAGGAFGLAKRESAPPPADPPPLEMTGVSPATSENESAEQGADAQPSDDYAEVAQWAQTVRNAAQTGAVASGARPTASEPATATRTMPDPPDPSIAYPAEQPAYEPPLTDSATPEFSFPAEPLIDAPAHVASSTSPAAPAQPTAVASAGESGRAPRLQRVTLQVQSPAQALRTTPRTETATINAPETTAATPTTLAEFVERLAAESADAAFHEQLQRRVLYALAGEDEEARRPLEMFSQEQQQVVSGFIELLISLRDAPQDSSQAALARAQDAVASLNEAVRRAAGLRVPTLVLCSRVDGFGQYQAFSPAVFPTGTAPEFVAYCELRDFQSRLADDGTYVSEFDLKLRVLDSNGRTVHSFDAPGIVDRCRSRRRDCFIAPLVRVESALSAGEYVVKITIVDKIGQKVAENRTTFRVGARS
ncbi:MAG: hypothetical protein D6744_01590 [Planctomycetota bacterium]|nr:MAG: hypothetical protein D6744_01590 [Planctomycetota bacterium]